MTNENKIIKRSEITSSALAEKKENLDFIINAHENFELNLNEKESINLINRLNKGSNDKAKDFLKNAIKFYEEMKEKEKTYKENKFI